MRLAQLKMGKLEPEATLSRIAVGDCARAWEVKLFARVF